jgi:hypothetical protein
MDGATEAITKAGEHSADNWVMQNLTFSSGTNRQTRVDGKMEKMHAT